MERKKKKKWCTELKGACSNIFLFEYFRSNILHEHRVYDLIYISIFFPPISHRNPPTLRAFFAVIFACRDLFFFFFLFWRSLLVPYLITTPAAMIFFFLYFYIFFFPPATTVVTDAARTYMRSTAHRLHTRVARAPNNRDTLLLLLLLLLYVYRIRFGVLFINIFLDDDNNIW